MSGLNHWLMNAHSYFNNNYSLAVAAKNKAHIISHANTINNKQKRPWQSRDNFCIFGLGSSAKVQAFGISGGLCQKYMYTLLYLQRLNDVTLPRRRINVLIKCSVSISNYVSRKRQRNDYYIQKTHNVNQHCNVG